MVLYNAESDGTSNGYDKNKLERLLVEAMSQFEEEALDLERAVSDVATEVYSYTKWSAKYSKILLMMSSMLINFVIFVHVCFLVLYRRRILRTESLNLRNVIYRWKRSGNS